MFIFDFASIMSCPDNFPLSYLASFNTKPSITTVVSSDSASNVRHDQNNSATANGTIGDHDDDINIKAKNINTFTKINITTASASSSLSSNNNDNNNMVPKNKRMNKKDFKSSDVSNLSQECTTTLKEIVRIILLQVFTRKDIIKIGWAFNRADLCQLRASGSGIYL